MTRVTKKKKKSYEKLFFEIIHRKSEKKTNIYMQQPNIKIEQVENIKNAFLLSLAELTGWGESLFICRRLSWRFGLHQELTNTGKP